jgi:hypothetical protein
MANYFTDNEDLQYYFNKGVDWEQLFKATERTASDEAPASVEEAVELYRQIHLSTSYFLTRREKVRRRNYEVEIAEFTLSHHRAGV